VPLDGGIGSSVDHLDEDQLDKLQELQKSLAIMFKMRREVDSASGGEEG